MITALMQGEKKMDDLISRQAAIDALADMHCKSDEDGYVWIIRSDAWARIDALPSVTPERKCGKWNAYYHGINETPSFTYSCSQCGYSAPYGLYGGKYSQKKWNYCPMCGADMRGEQNE